ncbi:hypothetical protein QQ008_16035 [Fulvivirgaceae bacterium BMA10]|uniref:Uncharacterized protein n=1 Tax=Splendidivirga corallicola TaxID=3051826 RepID=A0ABT8KQA6_9BACT|nr:hypothetical protein [Fulvivirgaceae bacterium BMA10]
MGVLTMIFTLKRGVVFKRMSAAFALCAFIYIGTTPVSAQFRGSQGNTFTYEELYDEPYSINKLFIMFQPLYGELYVANVNVGFGLEAHYYLKDKLDFRGHARKTYTSKFDFSRDIAEKNSNVDNIPSVYNYYELGATYHVVDKEEDTETKIILYSKRYKGRKWAAKVPDHSSVPSKVRKIYGVRVGGLAFDTSTDLNRALESQGSSLVDTDGNPIDTDAIIFGNFDAKAVYLGGSSAWIKNFAIKPDKSYSELASDLIFTTFLDIIFAPSVNVEDILYNGQTFSSEPIKTSKLGFRAGMEGKFNREFGWAYGAEMGYRPGIKKRSFYALVKISFPVFSTSLSHSKEAFGK